MTRVPGSVLRRFFSTWMAILAFSVCAADEDFIGDGARPVRNEAELRAIVDRTPPKDALYNELSEFYRQRESAAMQLGMREFLIRNAQEWFDAMPEGDLRYLPRWQLWAHQKNYGDRTLAMKLGEEVVAKARGRIDPFLTRFQLAGDYLNQYNINRATQLADEGEIALKAAQNVRLDTTGQFNLARGKTDLLALRSSLAIFAGKQIEAEKLAAASLEASRELIILSQRVDARRQHIAYGAHVDAANALRKAYLALGKIYPAELLLRETIDYLRAEGRLATYHGSLLRFASQIRLAQGRFADARSLAEASMKSFREQTTGLTAQMIWSRLSRLNALLGLEAWADAIDETRRLEADTASAPALRRLVENMPRGIAKLKAGDHEGAARLFTASVNFNKERYGERHFYTAQSRGLLGAALLARAGANRDAQAESAALAQLRDAIADIEAMRGVSGDSAETGLRPLYRRIVLEAYLDALFPAMQANDAAAVAEGFRIADMLRGAAVQQAVVDAAVRSASAVPGLGDLIRRLQDGQREVAALYDYIAQQMGEPEARRNPQVIAQMRSRLQALEKELEELLARIRREFPEFDQLSRPSPPDAGDVRQRLAPAEALLALLPSDQRTYLWLVTADGVRFAASDLSRAALVQVIARLRRTLDVAGEDTLPPVDAEAAEILYRQLVAPLRAAAGRRDQWTFAISGPLAGLPFPALLTTAKKTKPEVAPWLAREMAITAVPSVAAWLTLRKLPAASRTRDPLLAFGDPVFGMQKAAAGTTRGKVRNLAVTRAATAAPDAEAGFGGTTFPTIPPLPETRDELLAIAKALHGDAERALYFGHAASRDTVLQLNRGAALAKSAVVMFATHGLVPGDLPGLEQPALALAYEGANPTGSLLTLEDVLALKLDADWVVLSACNTAAADGRSGEAISGLGRGFFYAGARALLLTHWAVESESAKMITTGTFARYANEAGISRGEALRKAQMALIANPATAHPAYWAAFTLVGDGAR